MPKEEKTEVEFFEWPEDTDWEGFLLHLREEKNQEIKDALKKLHIGEKEDGSD